MEQQKVTNDALFHRIKKYWSVRQKKTEFVEKVSSFSTKNEEFQEFLFYCLQMAGRLE